jgi:hypothetical protein
MFADIDAEFYVLVDGDTTPTPIMIHRLLDDGLDMTAGVPVSTDANLSRFAAMCAATMLRTNEGDVDTARANRGRLVGDSAEVPKADLPGRSPDRHRWSRYAMANLGYSSLP